VGTVAKVTDNRPIIGHTARSLLPVWPLYACSGASLKYVGVGCPRSQGNELKC